MLREERYCEAIEVFGKQTVQDVVCITSLLGENPSWALFEARGMKNHKLCVDFLFFSFC